MGRKRKHLDGKYNRQYPIVNETSVGDGGTVVAVIRKHEQGKTRIYVKVKWEHTRECPNCHGKPTTHRWDNRDRIKTCGWLRGKLRRDYMLEQAARAEAENYLGGVDWKTGEPIQVERPIR
jgi:hypothetical protein